MTKNFKIRKATIKNLEDILRLNFELFKNEHKYYDKSLNMNWTYGKVGKKYFKDLIKKKGGFVEVVKNKGEIIGYLCGEIYKKGVSWREKAKYAELQNMFIEKKFRRKGLGALLVKDFINWCKKNKVDYVAVMASAKNKPGLKFYKRCNFKNYEVFLEIKLKRNKK